jgi:hypothetical protein
MMNTDPRNADYTAWRVRISSGGVSQTKYFGDKETAQTFALQAMEEDFTAEMGEIPIFGAPMQTRKR